MHFDRNRSGRLSLYKTEVLRSDSPEIITAYVGAKHQRSFKWSEAVQALSLLLVKYAACRLRNPKTESFDFTTAEDPEHAHSLNRRMDKEKEGEKSWMVQIFGDRDDKGHTPLYYLLQDRINPGGNGPGAYGFQIHVQDLPLGNLKICMKGGFLTKVEALVDLAAEIKGQWKAKPRTRKQERKRPRRPSETHLPTTPGPEAPSPGSRSTPRPSVSHAAVPTSADPLASQDTGKKTASPRPKKHRKRVSQEDVGKSPDKIRLRGNQSLADRFRGLSLPEIRGRIVAMGWSSTGRKAEMVHEVLQPECIKVIAEKVACAERYHRYSFYSDEFGHVPDRIKQAVSEAIQTDFRLGSELKDNLLDFSKCWIYWLARWFKTSARFYSAEFVKSLEWQLLPDLRHWQKDYSAGELPDLTSCLNSFLEVEAFDAIRALIGICLNNDLHFLRMGLAEKDGRESVLRFWRQSKKWMTGDQRKQVQTFLKEKALLPQGEG